MRLLWQIVTTRKREVTICPGFVQRILNLKKLSANICFHKVSVTGRTIPSCLENQTSSYPNIRQPFLSMAAFGTVTTGADTLSGPKAILNFGRPKLMAI